MDGLSDFQIHFRRSVPSAVAAFTLTLVLAGLGGCVDNLVWHVQKPQAVAVVRYSRLKELDPPQEVLPAQDSPSAVTIPYRYWFPRREYHPAQDCIDGPASGSKTLSRLTGRAYQCQGTAVVRRGEGGEIDLEAGGQTTHLVTADGTVPPLLTLSGYDKLSTTVWARTESTTERPNNDLNLVLVTSRANLASAMLLPRRQPLLGKMLIGFSAVYAVAGSLALAMKASYPQLSTEVVAVPGAVMLGVSVVALGSGIWLLTRSEQPIPLFPKGHE